MKDKLQTFEKVAALLHQSNFTIVDKDDSRPWGGFYVIDEAQAARFAQHYFAEENLNELKITNKLSPKILIVGPQQRLSWQYHHRRAEIWKLVAGQAGLAVSPNDDEGIVAPMIPGDIIRLDRGQRHRLVGLENWGMVAEIWQHTDATNPSDENDIVRVQDDFGR